jgi:hypothetical protein
VLLVDDDQAEVARRGEHGAAGADDDVNVPGADPPPVAAALGVAQVAVQDGYLPAAPAERLDRLRGQADLGDQDQRLLALPDDLLDGAQVELGLAAAGHAIEEERAETALAQGRLQLRPGLLLVRVQLDVGGARDLGLRGQGAGGIDRLDAADDAAGQPLLD